MRYAVTLADIRAAHDRIRERVHRTPVMRCTTLDQMTGAQLYLKCENLQRGGAFKIRGATNAIASLAEESLELPPAFVAHSSGNHAQAVAIAAKSFGVPAHIVMPQGSPVPKREAVAGYGATIHECEPTLEAREREAARWVEKTSGVLIPPYDDPRVIAGQGTVALELLEQVENLDAVVVPVGGGGLISGIALALHELAPSVRVIGAEPMGADDAYRSKASGLRVARHTPNTVADGLRTTLGELTWPVVRDLVDEIVLVSDDEIVEATRALFSRAKLVVEPSGATSLAAVAKMDLGDKRLGVVLSGGNIDLDRLPWTASSQLT